MVGRAAEKEGERQGDFVGGKYLLEECLGVGGMGEVYRATNVSLGRKVAIKLLSKEHTKNEDDVLRFLREARAAAAVRHPNVVDVFDVARDDDGTPFIVQELLSGEDLEQHLGGLRDGRVSVSEALEIMIPVAEAVTAAHARDVVHRDLKPANIYLAREGNKIIPKVLDFGACLYQTVGALSAKERRMLIGTPHYMAPEQITTAKDVDVRADVWAMGVILYELLVGDTPFEAPDANAVMKLVRTQPIPRLRKVAPAAPEALEALVEKCLERDRTRRFLNAAAVCDALEGVRKSLVKSRPRIDTPAEHARAAAFPAPAMPRARRIDDRQEADVTLPPRVPLLASKGATLAVKKRRGSSLMSLSAPDEVSWELESPRSASRPIEAAEPVRAAADMRREVEKASGNHHNAQQPPDAKQSPGVPRALTFDEDPGADRLFELDFLPSASRLGVHLADSSASSMPPVLDPLSASRGSRSEPPVSAPPSSARLQSSLRLDRAQPRGPVVAPPAQLAPPASGAASPGRPRTSSVQVTFALSIVAPALVVFFALRQAPFLTAPLGHAMRGDSPLASGMLAVVALVGAAALATRALGGERSPAMVVATIGAVLLGIVMIIVTFSASETAELEIPPAAAGIVPFVAPIVPLALAFNALLRAQALRLSRYERRESVLFAVLASLMLLGALELGPFGAARASTSRSTPAAPRSAVPPP